MDTKKWLLLILIPHVAMAQVAPAILPYQGSTQYTMPYTSSYSTPYTSSFGAPSVLPYGGNGSSLFNSGGSLFNSTGSLFGGLQQAPAIAPFQSNPFNNGFNSPFNSPVMAPYMNNGGLNPFMSGGALSPFMAPRGPRFAPYSPFGPMRPPFGRRYMMPPYGSGYGSNGNGMLGLLAIGALALFSAFGSNHGGGIFHPSQTSADTPPVAPPPAAPASTSNEPAQLDDEPAAAPAEAAPQVVREGRANAAPLETTSSAPAQLPAIKQPAPPSPQASGPKEPVAAPPRQTIEQKRVDIPVASKTKAVEDNAKTEAAAPGPQAKNSPSENCKYGDPSMSAACEEINQIRRQKGLKDFALNPEVNAVALKFAQDLAAKKVNPDKADPKEMGKQIGQRIAAAKIPYKNIGAKSGGLNITVEKDYHAAVQHWMKTAQKENLLNPNFSRIGIGQSNGYWVFVALPDAPTTTASSK
jgi:uncharacterized protein YkwD